MHVGSTPTSGTMEKQKLPGTFVLIHEAWEIFTSRIFLFLGILLIPLGILIVLIVCKLLIQLLGVPSHTLETFFTSAPVIIVGSLVGITFLFFWMGVMLTAVTGDHTTISLKESFQRARHLLIPLFWTFLLMVTIVYGGLLLLVIPGFIFSYSLLCNNHHLQIGHDQNARRGLRLADIQIWA